MSSKPVRENKAIRACRVAASGAKKSWAGLISKPKLSQGVSKLRKLVSSTSNSEKSQDCLNSEEVKKSQIKNLDSCDKNESSIQSVLTNQKDPPDTINDNDITKDDRRKQKSLKRKSDIELARGEADDLVVPKVNKVAMRHDRPVANGSKKKLSNFTPRKILRKPLKALKKGKTLQDQLIENNKKFNENITTNNGVYFCQNCEFVSSQILLAKAHVNTCGTKKRIKKASKVEECKTCDLVFTSVGSLRQHFVETHQNQLYHCTKCDAQFELKKNFRDHLRKVHVKPQGSKHTRCEQESQENITVAKLKHWKKNACDNFVFSGESVEPMLNDRSETHDKLSEDQLCQLKIQLGQHNQLLLSQYMLGSEKESCEMMLDNLKPACDILSVNPGVESMKKAMDNWEYVSSKENKDKRLENNFAKQTKIFPFRDLVPKFSSKMKKNETKSSKSFWTKSEDILLKMALAKLSSEDKMKNKMDQAKIIQTALPGKKLQQIWTRLRNMEKRKLTISNSKDELKNRSENNVNVLKKKSDKVKTDLIDLDKNDILTVEDDILTVEDLISQSSVCSAKEKGNVLRWSKCSIDDENGNVTVKCDANQRYSSTIRTGTSSIPTDSFSIPTDSNPNQANNASVQADSSSNQTGSSSIRPDSSSIRPDSSSIGTDGSSIRIDGSSLQTDGSSIRTNSSSILKGVFSNRTDSSSIWADSSSIRADSSSNPADGSSVWIDATSNQADRTSSRADGSSNLADSSTNLTDSFSYKKSGSSNQVRAFSNWTDMSSTWPHVSSNLTNSSLIQSDTSINLSHSSGNRKESSFNCRDSVIKYEDSSTYERSVASIPKYSQEDTHTFQQELTTYQKTKQNESSTYLFDYETNENAPMNLSQKPSRSTKQIEKNLECQNESAFSFLSQSLDVLNSQCLFEKQNCEICKNEAINETMTKCCKQVVCSFCIEVLSEITGICSLCNEKMQMFNNNGVRTAHKSEIGTEGGEKSNALNNYIKTKPRDFDSDNKPEVNRDGLDVVEDSPIDVGDKRILTTLDEKEPSVKKGLHCNKCGAFGFRDPFNLNRHDQKMHRVTDVFCKKCEITFVDRMAYMAHEKNCYFICSYPNCSFLTKKENRFKIHERSHKKG